MDKKEEEDKENEDREDDSFSSIPYFPGRKNPDEGGVIRDIKIEGFSIAFGGSHVLLDNTSLSLNWGQRYGLIGPNGCGKSALMKALNNREVKYQKNLMVHMVEEEVKPLDVTAIQAVLSVDSEREALLKRQEEEIKKENSNPTILEKLTARLEEIESETAVA